MLFEQVNNADIYKRNERKQAATKAITYTNYWTRLTLRNVHYPDREPRNDITGKVVQAAISLQQSDEGEDVMEKVVTRGLGAMAEGTGILQS